MRRRNVNSHIHIGDQNESSSSESSSDNVESSGSGRSLNSRQQQDYERRLRDSYSVSNSEWSVNSEARVSMKQGRKEILDVIGDLARKSKKNSYFADLHRGCNYVVSAIIIFGSGLVGVALSLDDYENKSVIWGCFAICFIKGIYDLFGLGQRGVNYQYASHQLREKLRKSREAMMFLDNGDEMFHYAQHVREEIDEIEFSLFKTSYGPDSVNLDIGIDGSPSTNIVNDRNG